jgi:hypothetical protein
MGVTGKEEKLDLIQLYYLLFSIQDLTTILQRPYISILGKAYHAVIPDLFKPIEKRMIINPVVRSG